MISRFFIDRPVFATVLSIVITLIGGIALFFLPVAQYPPDYAAGRVHLHQLSRRQRKVVADTVARAHRATGQRRGGHAVHVVAVGQRRHVLVDGDVRRGHRHEPALVMVQNRVALAMPQLPTEVQNQGITIRKRTPDILMIVNLFSPTAATTTST